MPRAFRSIALAGALALVAIPAFALAADLGVWFSDATGLGEKATSVLMTRPDFIPGSTLEGMACGGGNAPVAKIGNGIWSLVAYDRAHRIAFATASTDQCSVALFVAPPPDARIADRDLSHTGTGRGVHVGMPYARVRAIYGGPPPRAARFVVSYGASVASTTQTVPHRPVRLPETITLVVDGGRVSAITIDVDESGLF